MTKKGRAQHSSSSGSDADAADATHGCGSPPRKLPLEVIVSRALDQELDWYFSYAESALHRERIGMLPSYAAVRVALATEPTDEACRGRALELARDGCAKCLDALSGGHA